MGTIPQVYCVRDTAKGYSAVPQDEVRSTRLENNIVYVCIGGIFQPLRGPWEDSDWESKDS